MPQRQRSRRDRGREGRRGGLSQQRITHPSASGACPSQEGTCHSDSGHDAFRRLPLLIPENCTDNPQALRVKSSQRLHLRAAPFVKGEWCRSAAVARQGSFFQPQIRMTSSPENSWPSAFASLQIWPR